MNSQNTEIRGGERDNKEEGPPPVITHSRYIDPRSHAKHVCPRFGNFFFFPYLGLYFKFILSLFRLFWNQLQAWDSVMPIRSAIFLFSSPEG